jgi:methylenetetrahydrofolate reductase (NADPH)
MRIVDLYGAGEPVISFEFFPPKTDTGFQSLFRTIAELRPLSHGFVSVTMGAGGSTRAKTVDLVIRIKRELGITAMTHLPCIGSEKREIDAILDRLEAVGSRNVLALRGDPPKDIDDFQNSESGFDHASDLAGYIKQRGGFCVGGACYPEVHPQAPSAEADLENLRIKVEAGAEFLITQLFFDNQAYFDFVERARGVGIEVPIVAGIMPITSVSGIRRMTSMGGGAFPPELDAALTRCNDGDETLELGVRWATEQCRELLDRGIPGIHFFTLNRSPATQRIHQALF